MRKTKHNTTTIILFVLFVIYLIVLFKITVFRYPNMISDLLKGELSGARSLNLIPFATITNYFPFILSSNIIIGISNLLGNLIMFLPLGYIAALLFPKMQKAISIAILALAVSLIIEVCQYIFSVGAADIDDIILNTLGGVGGYLVYILTSRLLKPKPYAILISALMIAFTCLGLLTGNNNENIIQGNVKEINNDSIIVSYRYRSRSNEENTSATAATNEQFEVIFSESCIITLVEMQSNGDIIEEKTIEKDDIRLSDLILIHRFLINEEGTYIAEDVEIHRTK